MVQRRALSADFPVVKRRELACYGRRDTPPACPSESQWHPGQDLDNDAELNIEQQEGHQSQSKTPSDNIIECGNNCELALDGRQIEY